MEKVENLSNAIEEKRRHPRVESNLPVQYRNLKKVVALPTGSLSTNISEGGVRFKSNEFISLACRLILEITLPTTSRPIKAISKVAWIRKLPSGEAYELGNQFIDMTKEDKEHILVFINNLLRKSI